jgi:hypothetical protein
MALIAQCPLGFRVNSALEKMLGPGLRTGLKPPSLILRWVPTSDLYARSTASGTGKASNND